MGYLYNIQIRIIKIILLFFVLIIVSLLGKSVFAQEVHYDILSDTLIIINGQTIDSERIMMSRSSVVESDTFRVNKDDIKVVGFTMTALTLGHSIELVSDKPIFTVAMKNEILNKQWKYKFIYIKDINLQTVNGVVVSPSLKTVKIIFSN